MSSERPAAPKVQPRIIRFRDAPLYLGMDRNRFNAEVRPFVTEVPIGKQGIGFDRLELDAWLDDYIARNGRPAQKGIPAMGRKQIPGLFRRGGVWHIDKRIQGRRICQATGSASLAEAEQYLARLMEEARQAQIYGVRPSRTFEQAAAKFVIGNQHKRSIDDDVSRLKGLMPWMGQMPLDKDSHGQYAAMDRASSERMALQPAQLITGLKVVRRIVNLASTEWVDEYGLTWLINPPKGRLLPDTVKRQPYPLSWDEQLQLFRQLPEHLEAMALFAVNTGCRDSEICNLRWSWEVKVPELEATAFIIPGRLCKEWSGPVGGAQSDRRLSCQCVASERIQPTCFLFGENP